MCALVTGVQTCALPIYESQQTIVHRFLRGNFIHVLLELISITTALLTAILCFVEYSMKKDITTPIIGVALFCAGMLDVFHVLVSARLVSVGADWSGNVDNFSWLISRCYHALILMMGTGIFLVSSQLRTRQETERSAEHTPELQSLMRISYADICMK